MEEVRKKVFLNRTNDDAFKSGIIPRLLSLIQQSPLTLCFEYRIILNNVELWKEGKCMRILINVCISTTVTAPRCLEMMKQVCVFNIWGSPFINNVREQQMEKEEPSSSYECNETIQIFWWVSQFLVLTIHCCHYSAAFGFLNINY